VVSKGLLYSPSTHLSMVGYSHADQAKDPLDPHSISDYCTFVGGNLVMLRNKKRTVVTRSIIEAESRAWHILHMR